MWVQKPKKNVCEKVYIRNPATCSCENDTYAGSIIGDYDYVWRIYRTMKSILTKTVSPKSVPTNVNKKRLLVKWKISIFYLPFH